MRYFIGFLVTIGLIILLIVLLFGGGGSDNKSKVPTTSKALASYAATDAEVRLTIDGPVNANQLHQQVRITVGKDKAVFEQLQGYNGSVVNTKSYANSQAAYDVFLRSLSYAGFTRGNTSKDAQDERGFCPMGIRYVYELFQAGTDIQRYWSTSCGKPKTYEGIPSLTHSLFRAQIPDYDTLTSNMTHITP